MVNLTQGLIPLFVNTLIQFTTVASMYILSYGYVAIIFRAFTTLIYGEIYIEATVVTCINVFTKSGIKKQLWLFGITNHTTKQYVFI